MNFSQALELLKTGNKLTRQSGDNNFIFMVNGSNFKVNRPPLLGIFPEGYDINYHPHIDVCHFDGSISVWNPTQVDLFADDWTVVP